MLPKGFFSVFENSYPRNFTLKIFVPSTQSCIYTGLNAKMSLPECSHHSVTGWEIGRDLWWTVQVRDGILNVLTGHTACMYFTNKDPNKIITDVQYLRRKNPRWIKRVNLILVAPVSICDDIVEILVLAKLLFLVHVSIVHYFTQKM